jgi:hypothetical protein
MLASVVALLLVHGGALPELEAQRLTAFSTQVGTPAVLLPDDPWLLATAQVVTGPTWYTAFMEADSFSVYVASNGKAISLQDLPIPIGMRRPSEFQVEITRVHEIVTATFVAWGSAYDVDIECLGGTDNPFCGDDAMVMEILRSLRRVSL